MDGCISINMYSFKSQSFHTQCIMHLLSLDFLPLIHCFPLHLLFMSHLNTPLNLFPIFTESHPEHSAIALHNSFSSHYVPIPGMRPITKEKHRPMWPKLGECRRGLIRWSKTRFGNNMLDMRKARDWLRELGTGHPNLAIQA